MAISVFDLFKIGIGPSSSHTVGPMVAAREFVQTLAEQTVLPLTKRIVVELYGSLALTGKGHGTDKAILNGLEGKHPKTVEPDILVPRMETILSTKQIKLNDEYLIPFNPETDLLFHYRETLPKHSNGMRFSAFNQSGQLLGSEVYYSVGGGFIATEKMLENPQIPNTAQIPFPFSTAKELIEHCKRENCSIAGLVLKNEQTWRSEQEVFHALLDIATIMENCIQKGCHTEGLLPGGLQVKRRAAELYKKLKLEKKGFGSIHEERAVFNWLNVYAMAVNEENAAGGRVVTAPTNGAAGIIPAVLEYVKNFHATSHQHSYFAHTNLTLIQQKIVTFLLTAGAIAILYKAGASISGAEVGCQGEVGVASSMAAAGLAAALGGTIEQIENAAEIAMEHHLGMTCDPVSGLVQIPCIERNAMGSVKAVNAARLALMGDGSHKVSLDKVIATMKQTGRDMMTIYKETSLGGLAVNVPEC